MTFYLPSITSHILGVRDASLASSVAPIWQKLLYFIPSQLKQKLLLHLFPHLCSQHPQLKAGEETTLVQAVGVKGEAQENPT